MPTYQFDTRTAQDWLDQAELFERFALASRDPKLRINFERMAADARQAAGEHGGTPGARRSP